MIHEMNNLLKNSGIKLTFREFLKVYVDNYFEIRKAFDFDNLSNTSEFEDFLKTQNSFLVKFLKFNNDNLIPECKRRLNILHIITHL